MKREEIFQKISAILVDKLGVDEKEVIPEASFSDLGSDSLDDVEIVMEIESEFNITISDDEILGETLTLQNLIELVEKKLT